MKSLFYFKCLLILVMASPTLHAQYYLELSPALMNVDTTEGTTKPWLVDIRLGYSKPQYQLELAVMSGVADDSLNQLTVNVPSVTSLFYHYLPPINGSLKLHLILGASQVKVDSTYPGIADLSDSFYGMSYGIGMEESFKSLPQLKLSLDWIQLYRGDQININTTSLGIHYEF